MMERDGTDTVRSAPATRWDDFTSPGPVRARVGREDRRGIRLRGRLCAVTLLSGLALLALPALAGAATIVVDDTGAPSNTPSPAGSCEAPNYGTIQAAVSAATAGDTVQVCAGTYVESVNVNKQLTLSGPNAGISAGWNAGTRVGEATIQGQMDLSAANTVIDGLRFVRPGVPSNTVPYLVESVGVTGELFVRNSLFDLRILGSDPATQGCGTAIGQGMTGAAGWRIESNGFANQRYVVNGTATCGAAWYDSRTVFAEDANRIEVRGNAFRNTTQGVYLTGSMPPGSIVEANTFNGGLGVVVGIPAEVDIRGNTFLSGNGVYLDSSTNTVIENNLFCGGAGGGPEDPSFPQCTGRVGSSIWTQDQLPLKQSGSIARDNAILGGYANPFPGFESFAGRTVFNFGANPLDLAQNWWGSLNQSAISSKLSQSPGSLPFSRWIAAYTPDPAKEDEPGFWPLPAQVEALTPVSPGSVVVGFDTFFTGNTVGLVFGSGVTASGITTVTAYDPSNPATPTPYPQEPSGFVLGDPPVYYTISTTATFPGQVEVCLSFEPGTFQPGPAPRIYHYSGGAWAGVATTVIAGTPPRACGSVSSFSPFALGLAIEPPANDVAPTISGLPRVGQTLTASDGTWTGVPTPTQTRQWQRCDASGSGCQAIPGATGMTYLTTPIDAGKTLRVEVTSVNSGGTASQATSATAQITEAPRNSAAPAITGLTEVGETLSVTDGTWTGFPSPTLTRRWQRSDFESGPWSDIPGATTGSYLVTETDASRYLRAVVSASNQAGDSEAASESVAVSPVRNGFGIKVEKLAEGPVPVPSNRRISKAKVTCTGGDCEITKAEVTIRVRQRLFAGTARYPKRSLSTGESAIVGVVVPRVAYRRLGDRGVRLSSLYLQVESVNNSRLVRSVRVALRR